MRQSHRSAAGDLLPVDLIEMIAEVKREIAYRRRVYPGLVIKGTLSAELAARQIARMEAVLRLLTEQLPPPALAA